MRRLNLDQLEAFHEVVRLGNFTAAAQALNLTQPAITQKIRALETRLGLDLVRTLGKRTLPTDQGKHLLDRAMPLLREAQAIEAEMKAAGSQAVQQVAIGTGATACIHLLPKLLKPLQRRLPKVIFAVQTGTTARILEQVTRGEIDLALVTGPAQGATLETAIFRRDPLVLVAPSDSPLARRITPDRLPNGPRILYDRESATAALIEQWLARRTLESTLDAPMQLDSTEAIKRLIDAGLGWSVLPQLCVDTAAERRRLAIRPLSPGLHRELILVRAKGQARNRAVGPVWDSLMTAAGSS
ncbi:MAG: LysR family transcriptional regulator [Pseudomonadota bacterium]